MARLAQEIWRACGALGLRVDLGFRLNLNEEREIEAVARIADVGASNGMLIFLSYDAVQSVKDELLEAGYGFSVMHEPDAREAYDVESFKMVFRDWGWTGELGKKPRWMR